MERAHRILDLYGLTNFLADVERRREFWRDGDTMAHSVLEWASCEGFGDVVKPLADRANIQAFQTAQEFRDRHVIEAILSLLKLT